MKRCSDCREDKPLSEFYGAYAAYCKPCQCERQRQRRQARQAKVHAYDRAWYNANRERIAEQRRARRAASSKTRAYERAQEQKRRALKLGTRVGESLLTLEQLGERDGWKCYVCGRRINPALAYPHRRSASEEHIVALTRGGTHTNDNRTVSHWECNVRRGNRDLDVQLLFPI